ncbi:MAG: MarR family transcriptional regulator [Bacteroidales bacterium]|jgi:DNA-binding MarR family transcriptional regulator|nr:MarR family transcriptional regulator [Bacteroidales bacterium]MDD4384870.1 MarR family transcriptional regulator [Bacteroidales bacterium]
MNTPSKSFVYTLTRVSSRYKTELAQNFASKGYADVTPDYWIVLEWLWEEDNITLGQLAKRTNKDNASITRIIGGMERNDLVVRTPSASDKRSFQISMSKYARSIVENLKRIEEETLERATEGLNPIEVKELVRMLEHLFNNID